jgi:hypothetical protein
MRMLVDRFIPWARDVLAPVLVAAAVWAVLASAIVTDTFQFVHPVGRRCAVGVIADVMESLRCPDDEPGQRLPDESEQLP